MSSLFNIAAGGQAGDFYDHLIDQSLRITSGGSLKNDTVASTTRTYDSAQIFTYSFWFKPQGNAVHIISLNDTASAGEFTILYDGDNTFRVYSNGEFDGDTTAVFRDFSAWYHVCLVMDTTQATAANRARLYINGTLHALSSQPSQNLNVKAFTTATRGAIGARYQDNGTINYQASGGAFYIAEFIYADGIKHEPTVFGETKSGVWIPKDVSSISLGTNGYHLDFSDQTLNTSITTNSGFGKDVRSNMPNPQWITQGNLAVDDGMLDSPTNNFATLNPLIRASTYGLVSNPAPTNGNLDIAMPGGTNNIAVSTFELQAPNKYRCSFELTSRGTSTNFELGICNVTGNISNGKVSYNSSGFILNESATQQSGLTSANTVGDIVEILVDLDANNVKFALKENGSSTWVALGTAENITANFTNPIVYVREQGSNNINGTFDFGQLGYVGSDDENYLPMSTANLPEPAITPLQDDIPEDYFEANLWTGNGTSQSISSYEFSPDFVWIKERNSISSHSLYNTIMGTDLFLRSNTTDSEISNTVNLTSFDSNGFSLGSGGNTNENNNTYVGWSWLAGGTAVSNTDGSITSSVSANTKAGFSIVSFAVPASGTFTIGHGLNAKPAMIITKGRDSADNWVVYHKSISTDENSFLQLNTSNATGTATDIWGTAQPTSTVMGMKAGTTLVANQEAIAYCFAEVEGYSKFGNYVGVASSTANTFVYTGFRPAWVAVKQYNGTGGWHLFDNKRGSSNEADPTVTNNNVVNKILYANENVTEVTFTTMDFVSNGFKFRTNQADISGDNQSYIYMAFAEMPFKYANAR